MIRAHGIDISSWESYYVHPVAPPRPVDFVIQRTSYGLTRDPKLTQMKASTLAEQVKGAYHYPSSNYSWRDQCDLFLQIMDGKYDFWAWDPEKQFNVQDSLVAGILPAMEYLTKYSGKPGLIYTGPGMWTEWLVPIQNELLKYNLWVAHYWWQPNPDAAPNYFTVRGAGGMRRDWKFWQYDPHGQGGLGMEYGVGSRGCDLNVYNGTVAELRNWLGLSTPSPQPHGDGHIHTCHTCGLPWSDITAPVSPDKHIHVCHTCGVVWNYPTPMPSNLTCMVRHVRINVRADASQASRWVRFAMLNEVLHLMSRDVVNGYRELTDHTWVFAAYVTDPV